MCTRRRQVEDLKKEEDQQKEEDIQKEEERENRPARDRIISLILFRLLLNKSKIFSKIFGGKRRRPTKKKKMSKFFNFILIIR